VDAAIDVAAIADQERIHQFSIVGRSGGGPHALACAEQMPARVDRVLVLVGLAPNNAPGLDWLGGMTNDNVVEFSAADNDHAVLIERLRLKARNAADDPMSLLEVLRAQMTDLDKRVISDIGIRRQITESYFEALKDGADGWIDDVIALRANWRFDVKDIRVPVRLWHGVEDNFAPVSHGRWLANHIPGAELQLEVNAAHFAAMQVLPSMLGWMATQGRAVSPCQPVAQSQPINQNQPASQNHPASQGQSVSQGQSARRSQPVPVPV
jgi:pimeloyl-ACP methyl ester carboxylesterase